MNTIFRLLYSALACICITTALHAQVSTDVVLVVTNSASPQAIRNLHFGVNPAATNGTDMTLGEDRFPPFPPSATFEARFISVGQADLLDGSPRDYRPYTSGTQTDTFDLKFQPGTGGIPVNIKWNQDSLKGQYKSVKLVDAVTEGTQVNVDMLATGETSITKGSLNELYIIAEGPKNYSAPGAVGAELGGKNTLRLESVPNPVTGSTTIRYTLPRAASVSVTVSDINGKEVLRPVNNVRQQSGDHTLALDMSTLAVGTYFCTLTADGVQQTQQLIRAAR